MSWGPSIRHDGKGCPLPHGTRTRAVFEDEPGEFSGEIEGVAGATGGYSWDWTWWRKSAPDGCRVARIVRYRVWSDDRGDTATRAARRRDVVPA
ncbi:hypothetical protein [Roseivivax isoporae]|uniref:Uncharacterized protein n=1 Tax=Roseivivax isoporae LMG 25204 TaxID=1449351 RepID=X7F9F4_9RHOB|nr:hypothetical protein [Roseivivax isoporae]ETX29430.1 hypothetical protein RISW2_23125 [Roseivivax isoporae LMG 25204]